MMREQIRSEVEGRMLAYSAKAHFHARQKRIEGREKEEQLPEGRQEAKEQELWPERMPTRARRQERKANNDARKLYRMIHKDSVQWKGGECIVGE